MDAAFGSTRSPSSRNTFVARTQASRGVLERNRRRVRETRARPIAVGKRLPLPAPASFAEPNVQALIARLQARYGGAFEIVRRVDPALLGGVRSPSAIFASTPPSPAVSNNSPASLHAYRTRNTHVINADEIAGILKSQIADFRTEVHEDQVGTVIEVGSNIARVYGLEAVQQSELVEFPNGLQGICPES